MATFMMLRVDEIPEVFTDLAPIPQNDGPEPVCAIQYPTAFRVAYDYMRACWKSGEHSERSLQLSATCLKLNPANYTVWHYRRACMEKLEYLDGSETGDLERTKTKIQEDLTLAAQLGGGNPKNYQIWYHRRALLEAFDQKTKEGRAAAADDNDATAAATAFETEFFESEDAYIMEVILLDSKNYHAWSHRQWLIRTVNKPAVWDRELEFAQQMIQQDPRNNSAWNQRWFAAHRAVRDKPLSIELCRSEANFALEVGAKLDPYNESPFRYLIGLLREQQQQQPHAKNSMLATLSIEYYAAVEALRSVLEDAQRDPDACVNWTSARIDLLEGIHDEESLTKAIALATGMADQYDPIRKKYWELRVQQLEEKKSSIGSSSMTIN